MRASSSLTAGNGRSCGRYSPRNISRPPLADRLPFGGGRVDPRYLREQFVTALADPTANFGELRLSPCLGQLPDPRTRVRIVAVDQRSVDIEQHTRGTFRDDISK
jgi:hypothetical protein